MKAQYLDEVAHAHDMVKFTKNGSSATTAAVKLARAYTNKEEVLIPKGFPFFSYDDWFITSTSCRRGIPDYTKNLIKHFEYNSIESLQELFDMNSNIACVIMEPAKFDAPYPNYLKDVFELCRKMVVF